MQFQSPRGTSDVLPDDQQYWDFVRERAEETAAVFGFRRIETPMFEYSGLFERGVGSTTDIVEKETYTFEDRGGDLLTLRAEGTAPVCRAYLQHGMHALTQPVRLFYICPVFRYERPQAGRYRQHTQFGIEIIGESDAAVDAEVIEVGWRYLESVGLSDLSLSINSIGDGQCRPAYIERLKGYYSDYRDAVCADCERRIDRNALRLLDCKNDQCQPLVAEAPSSADHLCSDCESHWDDLRRYLSETGIEYIVEPRLVRGLDYYTRTVFEIAPPDEGRMSTIIGGGRYDGLIQELGGRPTPGIGYGMGLERVIQNVRAQGVQISSGDRTRAMVVHMGDAAKLVGVRLAADLRRAGISATLAPPRSMRAQMRYASSTKATHAVIVGDDELERGVVTVRDLRLSAQSEVDLERVSDALIG